jgi:vacuolar-type H+-ATPase subunit I/STV1
MAGELGQGDLDFYIRKVRRLENDNNILQDELNKVRVRLRRAEDYEIKYEVLSAEAAASKKELEGREKVLREMKSNNEKLVYQLEGKSNLHEEWGAEKRGLL